MKPGPNVLARMTRDRKLQIVDRGGSVHRERGENAAMDPINQVRPTSRFDDMAADCRDYRLFRVECADDAVSQFAKTKGAQLSRESFEPVAHFRASLGWSAEMAQIDLARSLGERLESQIL